MRRTFKIFYLYIFQVVLYPATPDLAGQLQSSAPGFLFLIVIISLQKKREKFQIVIFIFHKKENNFSSGEYIEKYRKISTKDKLE